MTSSAATPPLRNADLPRLGLLALVERDRQHAVIELGVDGLLIDGRRKGEAAEEARVTALAKQVLALLAFAVALLAALGGDGELLVLERGVELLLLEAGQLRIDANAIAAP